MTTPFMRAYCLNVIKICHRRGARDGGMRADSDQERSGGERSRAGQGAGRQGTRASDGHDGTWVAHPGLVPVALKAFDKHMPQANQISRQREDVNVTAAELLSVPTGTITEDGLRANLRVGIQYLEAGSAATAASRSQFDGGRGYGGNLALPNLAMAQARPRWRWSKVTPQLYMSCSQELTRIEKEVASARFQSRHFTQATKLFSEMSNSASFTEFQRYPLTNCWTEGGEGARSAFSGTMNFRAMVMPMRII